MHVLQKFTNLMKKQKTSEYFAGNSYKWHIFLGKDNASFVNFYQKVRKTNRALGLYANCMVFDITPVNWNLCFYVHLADLSSVRHKTSTWNEIKELIKSNYVIVPSLLNKKSENYDMEWSVGDEAIFRRTTNCTVERKWNEQP